MILWGSWPDQCMKNIPWHLFGAIHLVCADLMTNVSILPASPLVCKCTHLEYPYLYVVISSIWYPLLPFWLCSFATVSWYLFTLEIQKFMTNLSSLSVSFVSDTHHFLTSDSFPSHLPLKAFLLIVTSNY